MLRNICTFVNKTAFFTAEMEVEVAVYVGADARAVDVVVRAPVLPPQAALCVSLFYCCASN